MPLVENILDGIRVEELAEALAGLYCAGPLGDLVRRRYHRPGVSDNRGLGSRQKLACAPKSVKDPYRALSKLDRNVPLLTSLEMSPFGLMGSRFLSDMLAWP